jgi:hypothetical protein
MKENQSVKEKRRTVVIDLENLFPDVKKRVRDGIRLNFDSFYFDFIRYLTEEKPADVYFYFSKKGNKISSWETELGNAVQRLSVLYSINCILKPVLLKKRNEKILGSRVDHEIILDISPGEVIFNSKKRKHISELIFISSDFDFMPLLNRIKEYGVDVTWITDWKPLKKEREQAIKVVYLKDIFRQNPKFFKKFNFLENHQN